MTRFLPVGILLACLSIEVAWDDDLQASTKAIGYRAGKGALVGMGHDDVIAGIRFAKTPDEARDEEEALRLIDFVARHFMRNDQRRPAPPGAGAAAVAARQPSASVDRSLPWVTEDAEVPRVAFRTFESRAAAGTVSYHVYAPAEYDEPDARLPVLYWLHGTLGGVAGIRPLAAHFDAEIRAGRMPPMLVVFVNGLPRRLWADSRDGSAPVETVFITELIPEVDRSFRTVAAREGRILEGFSMGGYGAARLGFKHPELFAGISILAGGPLDLDLDGPRARRNPRLRDFIVRDVCGGDLDHFRAISPWVIAEGAAVALRDRQTVIRHAVGDRDDTQDLNRRFHERMTALGIAHEYRELPELGHDAAAVLAALAAKDGGFYRRCLGTPAAPVRPDHDEGNGP